VLQKPTRIFADYNQQGNKRKREYAVTYNPNSEDKSLNTSFEYNLPEKKKRKKKKKDIII
jgi:hypothetical protein